MRVSEALSKMRLSAEVSSRDVREVSTSSEHLRAPDAHAHSPDAQALRLFKASTMTAASGGHSSHGAGGGALAAGGGGGGLLRPGTAAEMERAEEFVAQRIAIGMRLLVIAIVVAVAHGQICNAQQDFSAKNGFTARACCSGAGAITTTSRRRPVSITTAI